MGTETTERRCKSCHKLLLDEKIPFCRRCVLEGRNKAGHVTKILGGFTAFVWSAFTLVNNNDHDSNIDDDKESC